VVVADFGWDDVGSWLALADHLEQDEHGNAVRGDVHVVNASGNVAVGSDGHLLALLGVEDLVVVHTPEATLVCPKALTNRRTLWYSLANPCSAIRSWWIRLAVRP